MKRLFLVTAVSAILMGGMLTSCKESTEDPEGPTPTVSISADAEFASDNTATVTLSLSEATSHDVTVALEDAEVQSGETEVTVLYSKSVTIEAGQTSAEVTVTADVLGLEGGEYQAAIAIASAEGANVAENPVVYINFDYVEKPSVSLYADVADVPATKTFNLVLRLSAANAEPVVVTLDDDASNTVPATYEKSITIPAGETEVEVPVTVNTDALAPGTYKVVINLVSAEGVVIGTAKSVSINLEYPFTAHITIDGLFDDWDQSPILGEYSRPAKNLEHYPIGTSLKLTANKKEVYVYFEFEAPEKYGFTNYDTNVMPYNFFVDPDGDANTGCAVGTIGQNEAGEPFTPQGFTYYVEGQLRDGSAEPFSNFIGTNIYLAEAGTNNNYLWNGATLTHLAGTYDGEDIFGAGSYENGIARIEVKLAREFFNIKGDKFRFALRIIDGTSFNVMSLMPQVETSDDGAFVPADFMSISLPVYEE